jgi:hypothetical protein
VVMESKAEDWNASEKQRGGHEIGVSLGIGGLLLNIDDHGCHCR